MVTLAIERSRKVIAEALVWDTHSGFMPDPTADLENLAIWADAGVDYLSINVGFDLMSWSQTVATLATFRRWLATRPSRFLLARTAADVSAAAAQGKLAVTFDLEGMNALDGRVEMVSFYYDLGVRQMLFAYNRNNAAGGGCHDDDCGLTTFGRHVIDEMNRVGMFVDVSHAGFRTSMDVMGYSDRPVIFSHSNAKVVEPHGRNITDEQAKACAATGGVIGLAGVDLFLGRGAPRPQRLAEHIDHFVTVAGPQHVGIGLDFGFPVKVADIDQLVAKNPEFWPVSERYHDASIGFLAPADLAETIAILVNWGYRDETLHAILGGNFLRLAAETWK